MNRHSAQDYRLMFLRLQPPGKAWTRRLDSNLGKLWLADGDGMARIEETAHRLMREANPLYCVEALEDWERVLGLPDECSRPGETLDTRREAVLAKLQRPGGQSLDFFLRFLGHFGDKIVIVEGFPPFLSDVSLAGDLTWECPAGPMLDDGGELFQDFYHGWAFVWRIIRTNHRVRLFRAGRSTAGDPLALWLPNRDGESPFLECRVDKLKPAHTGVIFEYAHDDLG